MMIETLGKIWIAFPLAMGLTAVMFSYVTALLDPEEGIKRKRDFWISAIPCGYLALMIIRKYRSLKLE